MSYERINMLSEEELKAKVSKIQKVIKTIPSAAITESDGLISKIKRAFTTLNWNELFTDPLKFFEDLLNVMNWTKTDAVNFVTLVATLYVAIGLGEKLSGKNSNGKKSNASEWLGTCVICSAICSIYMGLLEAYIMKVDKSGLLADRLLDWSKSKYDTFNQLWKIFKNNWNRPLKLLKAIIKLGWFESQIGYWQWQWELGSKDITHTYKTVFVLNWIFNLGVALFSACVVAEYINQEENMIKIPSLEEIKDLIVS